MTTFYTNDRVVAVDGHGNAHNKASYLGEGIITDEEWTVIEAGRVVRMAEVYWTNCDEVGSWETHYLKKIG